MVYNKDLGVVKSYKDDHDLDPNGIASPCGLIASSMFTDSY